MDETNTPTDGGGPPFQGPHWQRGPQGPADVPPVRLRLVLEPSGYAVELDRSDTLVGRHSSADIRLPLPDVSRRHCRFVFADGQWLVLDLDSLNGVLVNDQPVTRAALQRGDRVRIGGFTFRVDLAESTEQDATGEVLRSIAEALPPARRQAS